MRAPGRRARRALQPQRQLHPAGLRLRPVDVAVAPVVTPDPGERIVPRAVQADIERAAAQLDAALRPVAEAYVAAAGQLGAAWYAWFAQLGRALAAQDSSSGVRGPATDDPCGGGKLPPAKGAAP